MPPFLAEFLTQLKAIWSRLDGSQRLTVVSVLLATIVGIGALVWYAGQPDYESVLTARDAEEIDEATQALDKDQVSYKLDGMRILVDRELRQAALGALRRAGVQSGRESDDFGALSNLTLDSNGRREVIDGLKRRRAETAVKKMRGVVDAYVTADKPKRSPYAALDELSRPRAAVTVRLARSESFHAVARAAIAQVSSALSIPEEDVTAINAQTMERFSLDESRTGRIDAGDFLVQQQKRGRELQLRAQQILDRLYPDKALVTVTAELDSTWERRVEKIQPETPAIVSDTLTKNKADSGSAQPGGDPSPTAAPADGALAGDAVGAPRDNTSQETRTREYEPFSGTRDSGMLAPAIKKLSIALVLDQSISDKRDLIIEAVKGAVGYVEGRDSGLSTKEDILTDVFPEVLLEPDASGTPMFDLLEQYGPTAGQVVAVLLVLLFLRSLLRRSTRLAAPAGRAAEPDSDERTPESSEDQARRMRREIERSIAEDPASISRLLERWLAENRT